MTRALITGISGQDGAYLAQHLLTTGYEVVGGLRRSSSSGSWRLRELGILDDVQLVDLELLEDGNIHRALNSIEPDEVYNLAAQSFVQASFEQPTFTADVDGIGPIRILEALRTTHPTTRFYQASTSEMFGNSTDTPQSESTPFQPSSPYAAAKLMAHWTTVLYREAYGMYAVSGILFNHESPLRGTEFVTRKITRGLASIRLGLQSKLALGNLAAERDWGHARDFVRGMAMMTQAAEPSDFVLATGQRHSVETFVETAAAAAGFDLEWEGEGIARNARDVGSGAIVVEVDPDYFRPVDVKHLCGDATRAKAVLGWEPEISFEEMVEEMVEADLRRLSVAVPTP